MSDKEHGPEPVAGAIQLAIEQDDFLLIMDELEYKELCAGGSVRLGGNGRLSRAVDLLPKLIGKLVELAVPEGFVVTELKMSLQVKGEFFGSGVNSTVDLKMKPGE